MTDKDLIASMAQIESKIFLIRGQKVMLDTDLAVLYEVETKVLNQAVKRNIERFPEDFMFQLKAEEVASLRSQSDTSSLRSQFVTSNNSAGRGGRRSFPYTFTEQGVALQRAAQHSRHSGQHRNHARLRAVTADACLQCRVVPKIGYAGKKYDIKFKAVFEAIHELMTPYDLKKKRPIGFAPWEKK